MAKKPFDTTTFVEYPKHVYNPANPGEYKVANTAADVPQGWIDHYPTGEENQGATKPNGDQPSPLSRDQLIEALREGGVHFNSRASTKHLEEQLMDELRDVLTNREVDVPPGANVVELLKLAGSKVV